MPLSQSSKQGLIVMYIRSLPGRRALRKRRVITCVLQSSVLRWVLPATYSFGWAGSSGEISSSPLFYEQETLERKPSL